ncbi:MAG: MFS transporter [Prolixibacteraceae bacterium]|jgi:MFS family permease|nr:MFS transporter [Prolixibacteraceae bacterium]MDD4755267.1 MFS transporter [Prolixibacteraceae bacterium]
MKSRWNEFPFKPAKVPFFYGWVILFASVVGILMSAPGQTIGVSTFTDYLIDNIGLSRNQISTSYMVGTIASSLILTWAGRMYDRYGARWTAMAASLLMAFVLVCLSQSDRIIRLIVNDVRSNFYTATAVVIMILLFFVLRFSGQGVLTMVSRNMLMKWFVARRGIVNGLMSVFVALGFSVAPLAFDQLIQLTSWRHSWLIMGVFAGVIFTIFVFIFFRDNPEESGLLPDGEKHGHREHHVTIKAFQQYTLKEVRKTLSFWLYALPLAVHTLYVTAFTFHLVSLFDMAGLNREKALGIFIPVSVISVFVSLAGGWLCDRIKLKYLLIVATAGELIALISLGNLNDGFFYYSFIIGHGIIGGLFNVLMTVTWPRFYGQKHLGSISGFVMSLVVFSSALGPVLYSFSLTRLGSYDYASLGFAVLMVILLAFSFKGDNPQDKFENETSKPIKNGTKEYN